MKTKRLAFPSFFYPSFLRVSLRHGFGATDWLVDIYSQPPPSPPYGIHSPLLSRGHGKSILTIEIRGRSDSGSGRDGGSESEVEGRGFGTGCRGRGTLYNLSVKTSIEKTSKANCNALQSNSPDHQYRMGFGVCCGGLQTVDALFKN